MGYDAYGEGTLSFPLGFDPAAVIAYVAAIQPSWASAPPSGPVSLEHLLVEIIGFEYVDIIAGDGEDGGDTASVTYNGRIGDFLDQYFSALAAAGVTGEVLFTGGDRARWKSVLERGVLLDLTAQTYYPGAVGSDAEVLTLTRGEVRALLALVVGGEAEGLADVILRLTASLA
jgi:hypothetical protein